MVDHDENIRRDTERLRKQLGAQEAAYEAWKRGETHPDDPLYEQLWKDGTAGVGADKALDRLNRDRRVLAQLASNEIVFEQIPGWRALGATQDMVIERLEQRVAMYEEALRSHGRNLSVNQGHVQRLRLNR